ncbi:TIGR03086 family metal-binding protein [Streptomyces beijiangensis]|uniref:TIGR03086 family protein n=1 Tax=Streptomyces beijiangensis TaxID=163361 RepID=A0A939F5C5_9ACTN|nr:TIGR03086 family metal-binding protein [Streptomyces beijiangensis]MBO0512186.1 TIGR03086 family protein [Streptomyces beijiangensis]
MSDLITLHRRVMETTTGVVAAVRPGQLALPTPCGEWNLSQLLAHMTGQNHGFAAVARGERSDASVFADRPVDEDPAAGFAASAADVLTAFAEPGVLERGFWLPEIRDGITLPGRIAVGFHFIDYVVHGWDVAASLGVPITFDAEVLAAGVPIAEAVPDDTSRKAAGAAFAPGLDSTPDAAPFDRILRLLGRDPGWS